MHRALKHKLESMALSKDSLEVSFDDYAKLTQEKVRERDVKIVVLEEELSKAKKNWS